MDRVADSNRHGDHISTSRVRYKSILIWKVTLSQHFGITSMICVFEHYHPIAFSYYSTPNYE